VTATPIHNCVADLLHLLRLFLRDHALAALGVPSLRNAARREADRSLAQAAVARVIVARSRERVRAGYDGGPVSMVFPRATTAALRAAPAPDALITALAAGVSSLRAGGGAAPLLRLMLLRRLGSSIAAFRAALTRHEAYLDLATGAATEGARLRRGSFSAASRARPNRISSSCCFHCSSTRPANRSRHSRMIVAPWLASAGS